MDGIASFDEINRLGKARSEPFDKYFDDMDLTDKQKEERISFSEDTNDVLLFIIALIALQDTFGVLDKGYVTYQLETQYRGVIASYMGIDEYIETYISDYASDFVDTTFENIEDIWFLSEDRAMFNAENEANTALNYKEYLTAIKSGKMLKTWKTYQDNRVRKTHKPLNDKTIPIGDLFMVGNSFMLFAKDTSRGASANEIINCRCQTVYS